jgi:hypothetical protein
MLLIDFVTSSAAASAAGQRAVRPDHGGEPEQKVRSRLERRGGGGLQPPDHPRHVSIRKSFRTDLVASAASLKRLCHETNTPS